MTSLLDELEREIAARRAHPLSPRDDDGGARAAHPFVTLSYAQSLDGSIARREGEGGFRLSGPPALEMTHALRGRHDAILVGVGTVVADDPELSVRLVEGPQPRPIVVDSRLRTPVMAKLLGRPGGGAWIATTTVEPAPARGEPGAEAVENTARRSRLEARGARILSGPRLANGWVDLAALLRRLHGEGIERVMVEGGADIITSFVEANLVDYVVVTVAPLFLGGLSALRRRSPEDPRRGDRRPSRDGEGMARLSSWTSHRFGDDVVLAGAMDRSAPAPSPVLS